MKGDLASRFNVRSARNSSLAVGKLQRVTICRELRHSDQISSQFYRDVPAGPFYGYNRPGAKASEAIIANWWRQGMMGGAKAHYDGIDWPLVMSVRPQRTSTLNGPMANDPAAAFGGTSAAPVTSRRGRN